jgi:hypothetical protein
LTTALDADPERRPLLGELRLALASAVEEPAATVGAATAWQPVGAVTARQPALDVVGDIRRARRRRRVLGAVLVGALLAALLTAGVIAALARRDGTSASDVPPRTTAAATTTVAPTTAAPATTAAAPPTTAVPTTAPPKTAAPTTVVPTTAVLDRARMAETFLRSYYSAVAARDYQKAWSMLTPEFQANTAGGYKAYTAFWDTVDGVEVRRVDVQPEHDHATWPIVANLTMRYTRGDRTINEVDELTLTPDTTGAPRIAGYKAGRG